MVRHLILVLCTVCLLQAADDRHRDDITWGSHVAGPVIAADDLAGRVLVIAMWDADMWNVEWIRQLSGLRQRYGDKLLLVASHYTTADRQGMLDCWSMVEGGEYITLQMGTTIPGGIHSGLAGTVGQGSLSGRSTYVSSIYDRACLLFDHQGQLVAQTNIDDVIKRLPSLYQAAPGNLAFGREWDAFAKQAVVLGDCRKNLASTLADLREPLATADMLLIEEAQDLLDRVDAWIAREQATITQQLGTDLTAAYLRLNKMAALLKGDPLGEPFIEQLKELKKDKTFQSGLKAEAMIRALRDDARTMALHRDPEQARTNKSYLVRIRKIENTLRGIIEALPATPAAAQAQEMLGAYGF